jgi:outer membrane protein TolC
MSRFVRGWVGAVVLLSIATHGAHAAVLTVDDAVRSALKHSSLALDAEAGVIGAKGSLWSAYSGVLPRVSGSISRFQNETKGAEQSGTAVFLGEEFVYTQKSDDENHGTSPGLSASWSILNFSSLANLSSARSGLRAARLSRTSSRNDAVLDVKQRFYGVVKAIHLAEVSSGALKLSRDDERRVRALFEVGSVSRSDVLKAQVRTAQSQLDSLTRHHQVKVQRIALANSMGVRESEIAELDTTLAVDEIAYDETALVEEATRNRPDLLAAEAQLRSAQAALNSARFRRLPYLSASGNLDLNSSSRRTTTQEGSGPRSSNSSTDRALQASLSLNWDLFDGFLTDGSIATARAALIRARDARDQLRRNLESDVSQSLLSYHEALERANVSRRALESATENLTQQKYNVGSSTILELIDAQVQLQTAQSDVISAQADIRLAEAEVERVRGRGE